MTFYSPSDVLLPSMFILVLRVMRRSPLPRWNFPSARLHHHQMQMARQPLISKSWKRRWGCNQRGSPEGHPRSALLAPLPNGLHGLSLKVIWEKPTTLHSRWTTKVNSGTLATLRTLEWCQSLSNQSRRRQKVSQVCQTTPLPTPWRERLWPIVSKPKRT